MFQSKEVWLQLMYCVQCWVITFKEEYTVFGVTAAWIHTISLRYTKYFHYFHQLQRNPTTSHISSHHTFFCLLQVQLTLFRDTKVVEWLPKEINGIKSLFLHPFAKIYLNFSNLSDYRGQVAYSVFFKLILVNLYR